MGDGTTEGSATISVGPQDFRNYKKDTTKKEEITYTSKKEVEDRTFGEATS